MAEINIDHLPHDSLQAFIFLRKKIESDYNGLQDLDLVVSVCRLLIVCLESIETPNNADIEEIIIQTIDEATNENIFRSNLFHRELSRIEQELVFRQKLSKPHPSISSSDTTPINNDDSISIYNLCIEIEVIVASSDKIDGETKIFILQSVEKIKKEILQPESKLKRILKGIVEITDSARKIGENTKPVIERANEIAKIISHNKNDPPSLPPPKDDSDDE